MQISKNLSLFDEIYSQSPKKENDRKTELLVPRSFQSPYDWHRQYEKYDITNKAEHRCREVKCSPIDTMSVADLVPKPVDRNALDDKACEDRKKDEGD